MKKSSLPKHSFLLNANLSRKIVHSLTEVTGFSFIHISDISNKNLSDSEIVEIAKKQKSIIVTHDLDYGEIYYLKEQGKIGVIMLRLSDKTSKNVIRKLTEFLNNQKYKNTNLANSLIIISDEKTRIYSP